MTTRFMICSVLVLVLAVSACSSAPEPTSDDEKIIYTLGLMLARNVSDMNLTPDELDLLKAGLTDGVLGREPKVDASQYEARVRKLRNQRRAAAASEERKAAADLLADAAATEGAVTLDSGLIFRVIEPAEGPSPTLSDTVRVHYHGTLRDGTVFDSSVERGKPATFPLRRVVPCWTEGLQKMTVGSKAILTCPPEIAYGDRGFPPKIPGGAVLTFEVELLEIVEPDLSP